MTVHENRIGSDEFRRQVGHLGGYGGESGRQIIEQTAEELRFRLERVEVLDIQECSFLCFLFANLTDVNPAMFRLRRDIHTREFVARCRSMHRPMSRRTPP